MVLDVDRAVGGDLRVQFVFVSHALHQCAGASVNEALRQLLVHGIGQAILDNRLQAAFPVEQGQSAKVLALAEQDIEHEEN